MPTRTILECSVCGRAMERRPIVEMRILLIVDQTGGDHLEDSRRFDVCSPACAITAARARIEAAWGRGRPAGG